MQNENSAAMFLSIWTSLSFTPAACFFYDMQILVSFFETFYYANEHPNLRAWFSLLLLVPESWEAALLLFSFKKKDPQPLHFATSTYEFVYKYYGLTLPLFSPIIFYVNI